MKTHAYTEKTNGVPVPLTEERRIKCPLILKDKDTAAGIYVATVDLGNLGIKMRIKRWGGCLRDCKVYIIETPNSSVVRP